VNQVPVAVIRVMLMACAVRLPALTKLPGRAPDKRALVMLPRQGSNALVKNIKKQFALICGAWEQNDALWFTITWDVVCTVVEFNYSLIACG
jgi:hypothetical protein